MRGVQGVPSTLPVAGQAAGLLQPPVVALASGKGGVGKTLLAVNLAVHLSALGYRTLLVDMDPGLANADVHLRRAAPRTLKDVLEGRVRARDCLVAGPAGMRLLPGGSAAPELAALSGSAMDALWREVATAFPGHDLVLMDTGSGIGPAVVEAALRADQVVVVTTPQPPAVTDAYALLKVLALGGAKPPRSLLVNQARGHVEAVETAARLRVVCARFLVGEPPELLGWMSHHPFLEDSVRRQSPAALAPVPGVARELAALGAGLLSRLPWVRRSAQAGRAGDPIHG